MKTNIKNKTEEEKIRPCEFSQLLLESNGFGFIFIELKLLSVVDCITACFTYITWNMWKSHYYFLALTMNPKHSTNICNDFIIYSGLRPFDRNGEFVYSVEDKIFRLKYFVSEIRDCEIDVILAKDWIHWSSRHVRSHKHLST